MLHLNRWYNTFINTFKLLCNSFFLIIIITYFIGSICNCLFSFSYEFSIVGQNSGNDIFFSLRYGNSVFALCYSSLVNALKNRNTNINKSLYQEIKPRKLIRRSAEYYYILIIITLIENPPKSWSSSANFTRGPRLFSSAPGCK